MLCDDLRLQGLLVQAAPPLRGKELSLSVLFPVGRRRGGGEGGADNGTPAIHRGAGPTTRSSAAKMGGVVIAPSAATALVTDTTVTACGHQWRSFNTGGGNCS